MPKRKSNRRANTERRYIHIEDLHVTTRDDSGDDPVIDGYAAMFNRWTDVNGWFKEKVRRGAFKKTIKESDVRALINHDRNLVLGRNTAKTLALSEDKKGLRSVINPPDNSYSNDLLVSMERGDIDQMSYGFNVIKEQWDEENEERELIELRLFDVSVVTFPMEPATSANVRDIFGVEEYEGVDLDDLAGAVFRTERSGKLTQRDKDLFKGHKDLIEHLAHIRSLIDDTEPGPQDGGNHSELDNEPQRHSYRALMHKAEIINAILKFQI